MSQHEPDDKLHADFYARQRESERAEAPSFDSIVDRRSSDSPSGSPGSPYSIGRLTWVGLTAIAASLTIVAGSFWFVEREPDVGASAQVQAPSTPEQRIGVTSTPLPTREGAEGGVSSGTTLRDANLRSQLGRETQIQAHGQTSPASTPASTSTPKFKSASTSTAPTSTPTPMPAVSPSRNQIQAPPPTLIRPRIQPSPNDSTVPVPSPQGRMPSSPDASAGVGRVAAALKRAETAQSDSEPHDRNAGDELRADEALGKMENRKEALYRIVAQSPVVDLDNLYATTEGEPGPPEGVVEAVQGSRTRDFKAVVSGVQNVDPLTGQFMSLVNSNSIDQMELITEGTGVEFGRAQGGFAILTNGNSAAFAPVTTSSEPLGREEYNSVEESGFVDASTEPLSTFSIDVDTASYSNVRRFLTSGILPPADSVRIEELINYFGYDYPEPAGSDPFAVDVELGECPWNTDHLLARIGLQAKRVKRSETAGSNLVFLLDVSGSMDQPNKLPLVQQALRLLSNELTGSDRVAIVVYAGSSGLVLDSTSGDSGAEFRLALDRLKAGGSTAGAEGIRLAYKVARDNFIEGGVNRVILATDGDFNVGVTGQSELLDIIKADADRGIFLTALGFGTGNLQDGRLEQLADKGNGSYAYIDSLNEARKVLVEELEGTLYTVAKDVKIQVEFNPAQVAGYRLIGYDNRRLANADFNDDKKDAGEIGSGHSVTALYEIVPSGRPLPNTGTDALKYQIAPELTDAARSGEWMTVKLRYKEPDGKTSRLIEQVATGDPLARGATSEDFDFAAAVASFGMLLRGSDHAGDATLESIRAQGARGATRDRSGYRAEFLSLIDAAAPGLRARDAVQEFGVKD